jgi:pimeloyl-ACP methyl ester carboxylesterase
MDSGFDNPDQVLDDYRAMTYTSYDEAEAESDDFTKELPLDERFKRTPVPLMVIFGTEDQIVDSEASIEGYADVPGVQTELIKDAGHAPQVEQPEEVAELLDDFSVAPEAPRDLLKKPSGKKKQQKSEKNGKKSKKKGGGND